MVLLQSAGPGSIPPNDAPPVSPVRPLLLDLWVITGTLLTQHTHTKQPDKHTRSSHTNTNLHKIQKTLRQDEGYHAGSDCRRDRKLEEETCLERFRESQTRPTTQPRTPPTSCGVRLFRRPLVNLQDGGSSANKAQSVPSMQQTHLRMKG